MAGITVNGLDLREPQRDVPISSFGVILQTFAHAYRQVEVVVFYDTEGETVDYFTYSDPFDTRLVAAHHGVIFDSTRSRLEWLGHGEIEVVSFSSNFLESLTVPVGDEYRLTVLAPTGTIDVPMQFGIVEAVDRLKSEAGL